jgi:hypothetical protein
LLTKDFDLNVATYNSYNKLYLSLLFAISIGCGFLHLSHPNLKTNSNA